MESRLVLLFLAVFMCMTSCGIGSAYTETQLTTNPSDQYNPSLYDKYITWTDTRNGGTDIYFTDMVAKVQTRVTKSGTADMSCVDYGKVVYQDSRNGNLDIYMYDISTKIETRITTDTADQVSPSVYGNRIVWEDQRNGNPEIYLLDLSSKKESRLTPGICCTEPSIFRDKVVWIDDKGEIILYNLTLKRQTVIVQSSEIPLGLVLSGNRIIWNEYDDNYDGDAPTTHIYDFSTQKEIYSPFGFLPDPAFYGNNIVYSNCGNGNCDIYMATLDSEFPAADFSASKTSGYAPLTVKFTDKSIGVPTAWKWSFGDGSALVTEYNPTHTYSKPGTYTVKETVSNDAGKDTEIKTNYITVKAASVKGPVAAFTASTTSGKAPLKVQFTDKSTNSPTSWKWNFGDGTYSTSKNPSHTYSKAGKYTVYLTAKNAAGSNTKIMSGYITVK